MMPEKYKDVLEKILKKIEKLEEGEGIGCYLEGYCNTSKGEWV